MSMQPCGPGEVPPETVRVARAAFPRGSLAIRVRDELGVLFSDEEFADLFPARGKPAWSPGRLALVSVLQFVEGLTDRQAAEAVRGRIDFKYALGLELTDPGFDFSVLSEFRDRVAAADQGRRVLDGILAAAREKGLLAGGGRARTDSTHVLAATRDLCWLEMVAETLRAALNVLAATAGDWLVQVAEPDWFKHYAGRAEDSRFPKARTRREEVGRRIGADGMRLLEAVTSPDAPGTLRTLPQVEALRQVWVHNFHLVEGQVRRRAPKDRPPGVRRLTTPYDIEARGGAKRDTFWDGYKVHLIETCGTSTPNLITHVATTDATVSDFDLVPALHAGLAERRLLPDEHLVDTGYVTARHIVAARRDHSVDLVGPMMPGTGWQDRSQTAFPISAFTIDWEGQKVTCPGGKTSTRWAREPTRDKTEIRVQFSQTDCRSCPVKDSCTRGPRRKLTLQDQDIHQVLHRRRAEQETTAWMRRYRLRAGVEGTISQGVQRCGLRRSRYRGLTKTSLQHQLTGAALNLTRIDAHLTNTPRAGTRTSHFAALHPAGQQLDGAK
ncbi:IS1182 family transposase [Streptomyces spirodelae]|uniref:IS1182 family transposase n=1 Tax=Streptomyces spirodelae TaxID=2812904 RepID=A0ABS3X3Z0_9ACTN|nr:IS1182 family transposase [Streptomyces spirodelae]MBO8190100.1 IS1182 family transposase [Streptomyces spirodelae]